MKEFYVDFSGYMKIRADSKEEADDKFWELVNTRFNLSGDYSDDVWDVDNIEEFQA